jgi:adenylate kinase family enzyme
LTEDTQIELTQRAETVFPEVEALTVADDTGLAIMTAHMSMIKDWLTKWDERHDTVIDKISESLKAAKALKFDEHRSAAVKARDYADGQITRFVIEQENKAKERRRLAQVKADQDAARDREKEVAKLQKIDAPAAEIKAAERAPMPVVPAAPVAEVEKPKGLVTKHNWSAEAIADESLGIIAILRTFGVTPKALKEKAYLLKYLEANWKSLNSEARSAEHQFSVPGFKAVDNPSSHTRR